MGFYLTTPIKEKVTSSNKTPKLSFVASSMQGIQKRIINNTKRMEDKHGGRSYCHIEFQ